MIFAWIRFGFAALLIVTGLLSEIFAIIGVYRFKTALERMHSAAMGDTLGLMMIVLGLVVAQGFCLASVKLIAVVIFMWLASPVASHLIAELEVITNEKLSQSCIIEKAPEKAPERRGK